MAYIDVLPLETVKTYLRIDDTQNETDAEIASMITSALLYIEKHTNVIVSRQATKEYIVKGGCVKVYDTPINSVVKGIDEDGADVTLTFKTNYNKEEKSLYTNYYGIETSAVKLVLDVGHTAASDVPEDLINLALVIIKVMYYEQESDLSFKEMLPSWANSILQTNRRFLV